jgi:hypothetical protein
MPAHAAFIAGYICHLQADSIWVHQIFLPYFGPKVKWGDFRHRLNLHNVLRTYLDEKILDELPQETGDCLGNTDPADWLPFTRDRHLTAWRDLIAKQLHPGAKSHTVDVFASRGGISTDEFSDILHSEKRLEDEVFSIVPSEVLVEYRHKLLQENINLLSTYLNFTSA